MLCQAPLTDTRYSLPHRSSTRFFAGGRRAFTFVQAPLCNNAVRPERVRTTMAQTGLLYPGRDLEAMSFARNYHDWVLAELAPWLKGRVAEIGAGAGNFSQLLLGLPAVTSLSAF